MKYILIETTSEGKEAVKLFPSTVEDLIRVCERAFRFNELNENSTYRIEQDSYLLKNAL